MRLIDADKLRKEIHMSYSDDLGIREVINEQPTAYDVDKVVEELRNLLWDCYTDSGVGIDKETGFKPYEREMERIVKQNRR